MFATTWRFARPATRPWSSIASTSLVVLAMGALAVASLRIGSLPGRPEAPASDPLARQAVLSPTREAAPAQAAESEVVDAYGKLPLAFVPNAGQTDSRVRYSAQVPGASFYFTPNEAVFALTKGREQKVTLQLDFLRANRDPTIQGQRAGSGTVSYVVGRDPTGWHTGLPTYGEVGYSNLWPGVDMVFKGGPGRLEYEFVVQPGSRIQDIGLAYRGAEALSLDRNGNLRVETALGALTDTRPQSYQLIRGERIAVDSRFVLRAHGEYGFAVGKYDARVPLVIDPGLVYSTFLGGSAADQGFGIAVDATGNAYVTGFTGSANFPTQSAFDTSYNGGSSDVFVTKLNATGTALVYSTYIGGSSTEQGLAIAVDTSGSAYVTGFTGSTNFPLQSGAPPGDFPFIYQPFYGGGATDAFVTKLSPSGTSLVFSTYAGGFGADQGLGIAVHSSTDVYVTGDTTSSNLRVTTNALQRNRSGPSDAFFLRLDRFAEAAGYMTYFGGSSDDSARAIAVDGSRNVYLTGGTSSSNFPTGAGSFDTSANGNEDAFATKLQFTGGASGTGDVYVIAYSTYLGGGGQDRGQAIAIDSGGDAHVTGLTGSSGATPFPTTAGAVATTFQGGTFDAFVTKLNPGGTAPLLYSTYLGGSGDDRGAGIAVDATANMFLTGRTSSSNFPTTTGAFDTSWNLGDDAFVTKLSAAGSLLYSTFLGGSTGPGGNNDRGQAIAIDGTTAAYVTGFANSSDFPTTPGAYDTTHNGQSDAFVTKLLTIGAPTLLVLTPPADTNTVGNPHTVTATVTDTSGQPVSGVTVYFSVTGANPRGPTGVVTNASGQATFTYTGTVAGIDAITAFADTNGNGTRDTTAIPPEPIGIAAKIWTPGPPASVTLTPITDVNVVGEEHCVTATVRDAFGNPVPDVVVRFSVPTTVTHADPASGSATTNASGQAEFCFKVLFPGEDVINAFADTNGNGTQEATEPSAPPATKTWILPPPSAFCDVTITNAGWIIAANGDRATFTGNAMVRGSAVQGREEYRDRGPTRPMDLESTELLAATCSTDTDPKTATIFGRGTIDRAGDFMFRIDVTDGGNGGSNDTYGIIVSNGYASGQQDLGGGNVNIHKT